mgnify:FL=1
MNIYKNVTAVILAGGKGTRLAELTKVKPKPLIKIGNKPIIWHIMKIYSFYGINRFIICLGFKGNLIKKDLSKYIKSENWSIKFLNTGVNTMTGGRIKQVKNLVKKDKFFCVSYGDGLSDVNIDKLIKFHIAKKKAATLTAIRYKNPKGILSISKNFEIFKIKEKPLEYINGGFFVLTNKIFRYLKDNKSIFEEDCLPKLSKIKQLQAFKHNGFWVCMDTMREKIEINNIWQKKKAPWKVW